MKKELNKKFDLTLLLLLRGRLVTLHYLGPLLPMDVRIPLLVLLTVRI